MLMVRCWACIAKMHIPDDPLLLREIFISRLATWVFGRGKRATEKIGVLVCWDQWYPEAARLTAMQGAEILFIRRRSAGTRPKSRKWGATTFGLGNDPAQPRGRQRLLRGGAEPCRTRKAGDEGIEFWGQSFVAGTSGEILAKASLEKEKCSSCRLTSARWI